MRGKLDKDGYIVVDRGVEMSRMSCPYMDNDCGTHCALCQEPVPGREAGIVLMHICHGRHWVIQDFRDERRKA